MATMRPRGGALALAVSALLAQHLLYAGSLEKLWDLDIRKVLNAQGASHTRALPVLALRFSPDGRQLAAVTDWYGGKGAEKSRLLVIQVDHPAEDNRLFEIEAGEDNDLGGAGLSMLGWSPSRRDPACR